MSKFELTDNIEEKADFIMEVKFLWRYLSFAKKKLILAFLAVIANSISGIIAPYIIGVAIDDILLEASFSTVNRFSIILLFLFVFGSLMQYLQIKIMGSIGIKLLYILRAEIFTKLQKLPLEFYNVNKSGDLITRINTDTEKLNQVFSETLVRLISSLLRVGGIAVAMLVINFQLALAVLGSTIGVLLFTKIISPLTTKLNKQAGDIFGEFTSEVQENLSNFKAIIAFNKSEYFVKQLSEINQRNYFTQVRVGLLNKITIPIYDLLANLALIIIIIYGVYLIRQGMLTEGLLISFIAYTNYFFQPLRVLATVWASLQTARAGGRRIIEILSLPDKSKKSDLKNNVARSVKSDLKTGAAIIFQNVSFSYSGGKKVLNEVDLNIEFGKTTALIGPTGGGKSTIANLMAGLYYADSGEIRLMGKDIKELTEEYLSESVGYILQEPVLFSGTIAENICFGMEKFNNCSKSMLMGEIENLGLSKLITRFSQGLDTVVKPNADNISLGQRQLIALIRAVLRKPDILIMDEATANIDTVTENLINDIITKLPQKTTLVIIAHRLQTIESADKIIFVNEGSVEQAISYQAALKMVDKSKRTT